MRVFISTMRAAVLIRRKRPIKTVLLVGWRARVFLRGIFVADLQQFPQVFDAEVGEGGDAVIMDPVDAKDAVLGLHLDADLVKPILILTEHFGDAGDGEDARDSGHVHAACAASGRAGLQFHGSSSSSLVTRWSLIRSRTSAR